MCRKIRNLTFVVALSLISAVLFAEQPAQVTLSNLPQYYPDYFEHSAIFTGIDKKKSEMLFGALRIKYDLNVQVHLLSTEFGTVDQLQPGMPVAFSLHSGSLKKGHIKKLWQLPAYTIPAH